MPGGDGDIYDSIVDAIEANGTLDNKSWRRLVLLALVDLGRTQQACKVGLAEMGKEVAELKHNNIMMIARKHSKTTAIIVIAFAVLTTLTVFHLGLGGWLMELFDIPALPTPIP